MDDPGTFPDKNQSGNRIVGKTILKTLRPAPNIFVPSHHPAVFMALFSLVLFSNIARTGESTRIITDAIIPRVNLARFLSLQPNQSLKPSEINDAIHLLQATGYCEQVTAFRVPASSPESDTVLFCQVKPWIKKVRFRFLGKHHYSSRRLKRLLTDYYSGFPVNTSAIARWLENIRQFYRQRGFPNSTVTYQLHPIEPETRAMLLEIHVREGDPQLITGIIWETKPPCILIRQPVEALMKSRRRLDNGVREYIREQIGRVREKGYPFAYLKIRAYEKGILYLNGSCGPRVVVDVNGWPDEAPAIHDFNRFLYGYQALETAAFENLERQIIQRLRDAGYPNARVTISKSFPFTAGLQRIHIAITPGERRLVSTIHASGVPRTYQAMLERWKPGTPWLPERFSMWLSGLEQQMYDDGFEEVRCTFRADESLPESVDVFVECETGPRKTVAEIQFFGNLTWDDSTLSRLINLKPGHPFRSRDVTISKDQIRQWYWQHGFFKVSVEPHISSVPGSHQVRVDFRIVEGPQTRVNHIVLNGLRRTDPDLVYRFLRVEANSPLRLDLLERFQEDLYRLGIFSRVDIPIPLPDQMSENEDLIIYLREAEPVRLTYGLGYQERDRLRGIITITHQNLFGRAYQAFGLFRFSLANRRLFGSFGGPMLLNVPIDWRLSAESEFQDRVSFDMTRYLLSFQILHHFKRRRSLSAEMSFSQTRVTNIQFIDPVLIAREFENLRLTKVSLNFVDDTRDDVLDPSEGYFVTLSAEISTKRLGSDVNFIKFSGQINAYRKLYSHWIVAAAFRGGWGRRIGRSPIMPLSQRFFAGGSRSHRGFSLEKLGPLDPISGAPVGGNSFLILSIENRFRLFGPWGAVAFIDIGNVFIENPSLSLRNLREAAGFGIRYDAPVGLIGIDFAWLLDRRPQEKRFRWFVTIGQEF